MAFDWFRRKFDQSSNTKDKTQDRTQDKTPNSVESESVSPESETKAETEAPPAATHSSETPIAPEDYLAWAKAAYQNLKQQSQPPDSEPDSEPDSQPDVEASVEASTETLNDKQTDLAPADVIPTESTTLADATITSGDAVVEPISVADEPKLKTESEPESAFKAKESVFLESTDENTESSAASSPPQSTPRSFLEQASASRQSRLEQLKATAIEEPEPEPEPQAESLQDETELQFEGLVPRLNFDADFLWSAEVLAGQGRQPEEVSIEEIDWLKQLRRGLDKTRRNLVNQLKSVVGQGPLNADAVMEIEALLLQADVGVEATDIVIEALQEKLREEALPINAAIAYLKLILRNILDQPLQEADSLILAPEHDKLNIWLLTGVNGAGKTTTIGKLAHLGQKSGYRCLIAAADTFRAAAVQQVQTWGDRSGVEVIANPGKNTDPAAVVFDAIAAAKARNTELLLVDTAGRLQNKKNLMDELSKIRRVIDKNAKDAQVESLLVLDATLGQNGVRQAEIFSQAANLSGVVLTKLDGTARGGVALAVVRQLGLPIRFVGAGERIADLRPFSSYEFVEALLSV